MPEFSLGFTLITDDADQQFWGDNELDSNTSVSDVEGVTVTPERVSNGRRTFNIKNNSLKPRSRGSRNTRFCWSKGKHNSPDTAAANYGSMLAQLSSFSVGPDGLSHSNTAGRRYAWKRPATRDRYRAAKEAREAAIFAQGFSSSSDSDVLMQRPSKARRRNICAPSDEDLVTTSPGEVCPSCQHRPKNAIIVHGRIGHACFCYPCTMKMLRTGAECPMCGRTIRKVVKTVKGM